MELKQTEQKVVAPKQKMSWQEFLAWLDEDTWAGWVNGEVLVMSPASNLHQALVLFLAALMQHWAEAYDLGVVRTEPFLIKLPEPLPARAPDIIFVAKENLHKITTNYLDGAPDIVVEIISPESRARDRGEKFYEYEQGGVKEYWLIDPDRKQAEFYRRGEDGIFRLVPVGEEGIFRSEVLKGFWLKVGWLWQEPLPSLMSVLRIWELA
ncbi:MAG: Uma2 family endonuclease [Armatimonadetes bacterium]|nr:Uma2 family endonuclease [Armatimonadota bacterium]